MKEHKNMPVYNRTDDRGRKIYVMNCIVDSAPRPECGRTTVLTGSAETPQTGRTIDAASGTATDGDSAASDGSGLVWVRWRLISAVRGWPTTAYWQPQLVDYGHEDGRVIAQAIPLIQAHRPDLTWNHSRDMRDVAGHVENAAWEQSEDIPPGINADLVVDPQYDAKAAHGLTTGTIRAGSIGLAMEVVPSHPEMELNQFTELQGREVDGDTVRWLPVRVVGVEHMAMVPAGTGADPNAGRRLMENTAVQGCQNIAGTGGTGGMNELITLMATVCRGLGIDVVLAEGVPVPAELQGRVVAKLESLTGAQSRYNDMAQQLQKLEPSLIREGETSLTAAEILARLPERLHMARHGEAFLAHQRKDALRWFDAARVDPNNPQTLSELDKRQRDRIAASADLQFLADIIVEGKERAESRFGPWGNRRSSAGDELPIQGGVPAGSVDKVIEDARFRRWGQSARQGGGT